MTKKKCFFSSCMCFYPTPVFTVDSVAKIRLILKMVIWWDLFIVYVFSSLIHLFISQQIINCVSKVYLATSCDWRSGVSTPRADGPVGVCACMRVKLLQSCLTLCNPLDSNLPSSSVHVLCPFPRQEYWSGLPCPPPGRGSSLPRDQTQISSGSCIGRQVLYH